MDFNLGYTSYIVFHFYARAILLRSIFCTLKMSLSRVTLLRPYKPLSPVQIFSGAL